ncbi:MAG: chemotaxis protein CheW, partial [Rhizobium sp.]
MIDADVKSDHRAIWKGAGELSVLTFSLNGETFAIDAVVVQEILDLLPETSVPGSLPVVGSVI